MLLQPPCLVFFSMYHPPSLFLQVLSLGSFFFRSAVSFSFFYLKSRFHHNKSRFKYLACLKCPFCYNYLQGELEKSIVTGSPCLGPLSPSKLSDLAPFTKNLSLFPPKLCRLSNQNSVVVLTKILLFFLG